MLVEHRNLYLEAGASGTKYHQQGTEALKHTITDFSKPHIVTTVIKYSSQ